MRDTEAVTSVPDDLGERRETHPAFGVAVVTRGHGTPRALFQSDLMHNETITLSIETAERVRHLNRDRVHPHRELVSIEMSLAQWGALVSSMGIGSGVPVTIRRTESVVPVPGIPHEPRTAENLSEVRATVGRLLERADTTFEALETVIETGGGKRAMREALRSHKSSLEGMQANAVFAVKSLNEAAESVVFQARADIEAHIIQAAQAVGVASIEAPTWDVAELEAAPVEGS